MAVFVTTVFVMGGDADAAVTPKKKRGRRDLVLVAGGDLAYPAGKYDRWLDEAGADLLKPVRRYLKQGDLVFVNLEGPLTTAEVVGKKTYQFTIPPERLDWLLANGVNLVSIANNHIEDAGPEGLKETLRTLRRASRKTFLRWAGASASKKRPATDPVFFKPKGKDLTIGFVAFTYRGSSRVATVARGQLKDAVAKAREKADIVIASVHYGKEYIHVPRRGKVGLLRSAVDAGADIVLGHHPHVVQGIERRGESVIFYSLGNFSFASKTVRHQATGARMFGMLPLIEIQDGKLSRVEVIPLYVNNAESWTLGEERQRPSRFRPVPVRGAFAEAVLDAIAGWSAEIKGNRTEMTKRDGRGVILFD